MRVPYLKKREKRDPDAEFLDILLDANSFDAISGKYPDDVTERFGIGSATVVVGNPLEVNPKGVIITSARH
jgi:hypothetical protein